MIFSKFTKLCSHHHSQVLEHQHHSKKFPLSFAVTSHSYSHPQATPNLFSILPVLELSWKWNHGRYSFLYLVFSSLMFWDSSMLLPRSVVCCFLSLNSNCWMAIPDYGHLEFFQFLYIMKNTASSEHSSLNSCVDICFHFSWVLRTRVSGS